MKIKDKWQPIETCPEDQFVFVWIKSKHYKEYGKRVEICKTKNHSFGWSGLDELDYYSLKNGDTFLSHWMPLPKPPSEEELSEIPLFEGTKALLEDL